MMDTSRTKTSLDDLKATARAKDDAACWDTDILESQVTVSMRSIIISVNRQHSVDGDAGSVGWNQNDRLLRVCVLVSRITFCHDNIDLASRVTGATRPPFLDHVS